MFIRTLAAAYAADGRFSDASEAAERALRLARYQNASDLARAIQKDIDLYRDNLPLRNRR